MNTFRIYVLPVVLAAMLLLCGIQAAAQDDKKTPDILESCELEADRLQRLLDLEDWQAFRVDSTLKHDYPALNKEIENLRASKISNSDIYQGVQDKWMEKIDESYRRIFTDEQWNRYLKQGAGRAIAARQKRYAKLHRQ